MYDCIYILHICECTALMSPNRAKQPYLQTVTVKADGVLQLFATVRFGSARNLIILANKIVQLYKSLYA